MMYATLTPFAWNTFTRVTWRRLRRTGADDTARRARLAQSQGRLAAPGLSVQIGGPTAVNRDINQRVKTDIARAEELSMPLVLVLLCIIFGTLAAASLPLAIGAI